jgi:hypothetical protein
VQELLYRRLVYGPEGLRFVRKSEKKVKAAEMQGSDCSRYARSYSEGKVDQTRKTEGLM